MNSSAKEVKRLKALIKETGKHWLELDPGIAWEGGIDSAMEAAVAEIRRLRGLEEASVEGEAWWDCKIGPMARERLPDGCDAPMRRAVQEAFYVLFGEWADVCFSGWAGALTPLEREVIKQEEEK